MEELCSPGESDLDTLERKLSSFLRDPDAEMVTGIRRMGRENLVDYAVVMCGEMDVDCSVYPDCSSGNMVFFYGWENMDDVFRSMMDKNPNRQIIFGQDLCHQVPALVRYKNDQQQKRAAKPPRVSARTEKVRHSFSIAKRRRMPHEIHWARCT